MSAECKPQNKENTMKTEIETIIRTEADVRVSVSDFDNDVWLALQSRHGSAHVVLNRDEARQIIQGLQAILDAEVPA
jgi:hypothetical protein